MNQLQLSPEMNTTAFSAEPYLPWLRTDPAMQQPAGFVGLCLYQSNGYEPMAQHFPAGSTIAMRRVTHYDDLTEGVYFATRQYYASPDRPAQEFRAFGRFAGLMPTQNERARARRIKRGQVHFELQADVLPANPSASLLRADGSETVYMDFNSIHCQLWRVTHYVELPDWALQRLGLDAAVTGMNAFQTQWLNDERQVEDRNACALSVQTLGGFPEPECLAVLSEADNREFSRVWDSLPKLKPSEAKKRKAGAVAITWRIADVCKRSVSITDYHRPEDAALLVSWLQSIAQSRYAAASAIEQRAQVAAAAQNLRAAQQAARAAQTAAAGPAHAPQLRPRRQLAQAA